ncbi:MAG: HPP family protein [Negativicutes bacterium]|nr:HPP family protein [Negativicutes bacterium]
MSINPQQQPQPDEDRHFCSMSEYWEKVCSGGRCTVPHPPLSEVIWTFIGCFVGIGIVTFLAFHKGVPVLVASLGASACLLYGAPSVPFAQPRNAIAGHIMAAFIGVACYQLLGSYWYSAALSVGLAVSMMVLTRTIHPPAGATALIAVISKQDWLFPLAPVGIGISILIVIAILVNNFAMKRKYPQYWW